MSGKCRLCGDLEDRHEAVQTRRQWEPDTFLPKAVEKLETVKRGLRLRGPRSSDLRRCPECLTFYLYSIDWEQAADGMSYDQQVLRRLTDEEGQRYLRS
ncbi:MAG: hypothetical protein H6719_29370 [Sandaracinaceae bacterium]|nr:hypothetical protein [Sandaracinaceae bacterium]